MTSNDNDGKVVFDIGIGTLSSNKELFIHAGSYTASYQQKGSISIKEKNNTQDEGKTFEFGPTTSSGYTEMLNKTYKVNDDTFYEVTVEIKNDQGSGGKKWVPSTIMTPAQLSCGNYHEKIVTSEDLSTADDVNDTIVSLVWFTKPIS